MRSTSSTHSITKWLMMASTALALAMLALPAYASGMIGGVMFPSGARNNVFVEGRYTASVVQQASISLGLTLR